MTVINYRTTLYTLENIHLEDEICDTYQTCGKVIEIEKVTKRNSVFFNYVLDTGQNISIVR